MILDRLIVEGKEYDINTVHELNLNLSRPSTRQYDNTILFYGKESYLSNFYSSPLNIDGHTFNCTEQYIQYAKTRTYGDTSAASQILESLDPVVQKKIGNRAKIIAKDGDKKWNSKMHEVMYRGLHAKFSQNVQLGTMLKGTVDKHLAEANAHDLYWGTGVYINRRDSFDGWPGKNHMGATLMSVRQHLLDDTNA